MYTHSVGAFSILQSDLACLFDSHDNPQKFLVSVFIFFVIAMDMFSGFFLFFVL